MPTGMKPMWLLFTHWILPVGVKLFNSTLILAEELKIGAWPTKINCTILGMFVCVNNIVTVSINLSLSSKLQKWTKELIRKLIKI